MQKSLINSAPDFFPGQDKGLWANYEKEEVAVAASALSPAYCGIQTLNWKSGAHFSINGTLWLQK